MFKDKPEARDHEAAEYSSTLFADEEMRDHCMPKDPLRSILEALFDRVGSGIAFDMKLTTLERAHYSAMAHTFDVALLKGKFPLGERDQWNPDAPIPLVDVAVTVRWVNPRTGKPVRKPGVKRSNASSANRRRGSSAKKRKAKASK